MTPRTLITLAAALLAAGCSGEKESASGEGAPASVAEAAKQAAAAGLKPQPGLYKTTITMTGIDIPGMPPEMEGHGAGLARTLESCLTQAEVDSGFAALLKRGQDGACRFENFALKDGAFEGLLVCDAAGTTTRIAMEGTAKATGADFTATTAMQFPGGVEGTMNYAASHERVGDCPASQAPEKPAK
ncbi:MAG: DUF3617 domain-containing protein [Erythrobacter sp.]|uniref:DUF3617 domain-containing protein n=1 Tax=Erythrobacter sp. TaxID=1042 RepID=UPI0025F2DF0B|nr:DUF3617 domain-containing protein [Erythrobacter sp.]MCL9998807.1 DUF3617 domain-containing protein [Erythrobacter sp.]